MLRTTMLRSFGRGLKKGVNFFESKLTIMSYILLHKKTFMVLKQLQGIIWYHLKQFHQNSALLQTPPLALYITQNLCFEMFLRYSILN